MRVIAYQGGKLRNRAYGFPRGEKRRRKPTIIACVHISGNKNTARMKVGIGPGTGTRAEVDYMARPGNPGGNSAHSYVARNGDMLDCIPWREYAAWNNGRVQRPNTRLTAIKRIIANEKRLGDRYNANEEFWWEVEGTGYPGSYPLTSEQKLTIATRIAYISIEKKIAINRNTVLLHADIDGINRLNCPFSAKSREEQAKSLIALANRIKRELIEPEPKPTPEPEEPPSTCETDLTVAMGRADAAEADVARLTNALQGANAIIDRALEEE